MCKTIFDGHLNINQIKDINEIILVHTHTLLDWHFGV